MQLHLIRKSLVVLAIGGLLSFVAYEAVTQSRDGASMRPYHKLRRELFDMSRMQDVRVVMLGDSLTEGAPWSELSACPFLINRGIQGDNSAEALSRLDQILLPKPRAVFITLGTNDLMQGFTAQAFARNVGSIVDRLNSERVHSYLSFTPPVGPNYPPPIHERIRQFNAAIETLAPRPGVTLVDFRGPLSSSAGTLREALSTDGVHFNAGGYSIWWNAIAGFVARHCSGEAK